MKLARFQPPIHKGTQLLEESLHPFTFLFMNWYNRLSASLTASVLNQILEYWSRGMEIRLNTGLAVHPQLHSIQPSIFLCWNFN
jgi:hypothetical protein